MLPMPQRVSHLVLDYFRALIFISRSCHYLRNMELYSLQPPKSVRGMLVLNRDAFRKAIRVPCLRISKEHANIVLPIIKILLLKMTNLRPMRPVADQCTNDVRDTQYKEILLHPDLVRNWKSLPTDALQSFGVHSKSFYFIEIELNYANWRIDEIFRSVLPKDGCSPAVSSYSRIGHVVHLNLRDHLIPFKTLIGEVIHDKIVGCRTVVNKVATIDNTYRNFQLELLFGDPEFQVKTKENGVVFEFDFSKVYWNPRLSTEHERIVQILQPNDTLYDVFAGVGPFSIPAARKHCRVLANDLNPDSFRWLLHNAKINKCEAQMQFFNLDGRNFIVEHVKPDLLCYWTQQKLDKPPNQSIHITMNLPALAIEFLSVFRGLFQREAKSLNLSSPHFNYPLVHIYTFVKGDNTKQMVRSLVEKYLGMSLSECLEDIYFVRNVAPKKDMYRISFRLTEQIITFETVRSPVNKLTLPEILNRKRLAHEEEAPKVELTKPKCKGLINASTF